MKRFKLVALGLALSLAAFASAPRLAAADEGEECCASMQQEVENICARMGTSVIATRRRLEGWLTRSSTGGRSPCLGVSAPYVPSGYADAGTL